MTSRSCDLTDTTPLAAPVAEALEVPLARTRARTALGAAVVCSAMYQLFQRFPAFTPQWRETCWSWERVPFSELWLVPYLSMFVMVGSAWYALTDRTSIRRFAFSLLGTAAFSWVFFLFWPQACLRPDPALHSVFYQLLVWVDAPTNCFPCLHSAFATLAVVPLALRARRSPHSGLWLTLLALWLVLLNVSIVALRQHTGIDVASGWLVGGAAAAYFLNHQKAFNR